MKRFERSGLDSTSSLSPVKDFSSDGEAVQSVSTENKKLKFNSVDKDSQRKDDSDSEDPAAAQPSGHVGQTEGIEAGGLAARYEGSVGQIEVGEHFEGSGDRVSSFVEGMDAERSDQLLILVCQNHANGQKI